MAGHQLVVLWVGDSWGRVGDLQSAEGDDFLLLAVMVAGQAVVHLAWTDNTALTTA